MVGCDYNLVDRHTMEVGKIVQNNSMDQTGVLDEEKHKKLLMRSGSMVIKIYRHSVIKENGVCFPEGIFYEDNCAGPLWSLYFRHFEKVEEPMYYYYQHQVSTVHYITEEKCRDRMKAAELLYEECQKRGFLEKYRKEIKEQDFHVFRQTEYLSKCAGYPVSKAGETKYFACGEEMMDSFLNDLRSAEKFIFMESIRHNST